MIFLFLLLFNQIIFFFHPFNQLNRFIENSKLTIHLIKHLFIDGINKTSKIMRIYYPCFQYVSFQSTAINQLANFFAKTNERNETQILNKIVKWSRWCGLIVHNVNNRSYEPDSWLCSQLYANSHGMWSVFIINIFDF